jgi:hypothetical protein
MTKPNDDDTISTKKTAKYSEWEIPPEDLLYHGRMVGRGTYGTVYKARFKFHGKKKKYHYYLF